MRTKTFLELLTLSSNLYVIAKDANTMEKLHEFAEKGKDQINDYMGKKMMNEDGEEMEFIEKMTFKMHQAKEELENKIEEVVVSMYAKMNIAHTDQIKNLEEKLDKLSNQLSLAHSRLESLENKK